MEKETYKTARELLERFDPTNASLQNTYGPPHQRDTHRAGVSQSEVRQRRQPPQAPHPALLQHNVAMTTPQAQRGPPVAMTTPQAQRGPPVAMTTPQVQGGPPVAMTTPAVNPSASGQQQTAPPEPVPPPQPSLQHIPPGIGPLGYVRMYVMLIG